MGYAQRIQAGCLITVALAMPAAALELSGVHEIRMETEGRLTVTQGEQEQVTANKAAVSLRQIGHTLVIGPTDNPASADNMGPAYLEVAVVVAGLNELVSTSDAHLSVSRFDVEEPTLTLAGHGGISVSDVVAEVVNISLAGHGNVAVTNLRAENVDARLRGHGSVQIDGLATGMLAVRISGHGSVEVSGSAATQILKVRGQGDYFADNLESDVARVAITGSGRAHLWVRSALTVAEMQEGTVRYRGKPVLHYLGAGVEDHRFGTIL